MGFFSGLIHASDELKADVNGSLAVCDQFTPEDIPDLKKLLVRENDPQVWGMRNEWQHRNDCQANAGTSGAEVLEYRVKKKRGELSRSFFYNHCERIDGRAIGGDQGTSMQSGVKLLTTIGCPLESEYPYDRYTRNPNQLKAWATPAILASAATRKIAGAVKAPPFKVMLAHALLGSPTHIGIDWPIRFNTNRVATKYRGQHGDGGHALEIVWGVLATTGQWLAKVANSHNDGYLYWTEEFYEEARADSPYGAYTLKAVEHPLEAYKQQFDLMG